MNLGKKAFHQKNILITGGLGFIGSNLARRLVGEGAEVTLVDSLIPETGGNRANIVDFKDRVDVNIADVRDPELPLSVMAKVVKTANVWSSR